MKAPSDIIINNMQITMKSLGIFNSRNIPISNDNHGTLFEYTKDDREIRIYFKKEEPYFQVVNVAILVERAEAYETFELFEYNYYHNDERNVRVFIKELVEPTAAREASPAKRPTTTISAALKSNCKILDKIKGIENFNKLTRIGPEVISRL